MKNSAPPRRIFGLLFKDQTEPSYIVKSLPEPMEGEKRDWQVRKILRGILINLEINITPTGMEKYLKSLSQTPKFKSSAESVSLDAPVVYVLTEDTKANLCSFCYEVNTMGARNQFVLSEKDYQLLYQALDDLKEEVKGCEVFQATLQKAIEEDLSYLISRKASTIPLSLLEVMMIEHINKMLDSLGIRKLNDEFLPEFKKLLK